MKDKIDFSLLGTLLKKQWRERSAAFRKGNFDAVGFIFRILLTFAFVAVFVVFFGKFLDIYLNITLNGVLDTTERLYELLSIVYIVVLIAMVISGISQINRALFAADDMKIMAALPVGARTLYVSKLTYIYLGQVLFAAVALLTVNLTVAAHASQPALFFVFTVLACFLLPLLSVGIASIFALPFHALKLALKNRFVISFIVVTLITAALLFLYAYLLEGVKEMLLGDDLKYFFNERVMTRIASVVAALYPANLIANILLGREMLVSCLVIAAALVACALISAFAIKKLLLRSLQSRISGQAKVKGARKSLGSAHSPLAALVKKEFLMIFRTPNYMFSYFAIAVVMPLMVYFCMSVGSSLVVKLIAVDCSLELSVFLTLLFGSLANVFCTTNISRDGQMFYSVKAMPVSPKTVIFSKVLLCMIVTCVSQILCSVLLCAAGYLSVLNGIFLFATGLLFGFAQVCIATRIDFDHAKFSTEPDGEIKESGNTVSSVILAGLVVSFLIGGAVVLVRMMLSLRGLANRFSYLTFVIAGGAALLFAALGYLFLIRRLNDKYYRFSGGGLL